MKSLNDLTRHHGTLIGTFATLGPDAYELACFSGLNLIVADAEHGAFDLESLRRLPAIANAAECLPVIRLPSGGAWMIESLLDSGVQSLIAPMVNTADQARDFVSRCYYPPLGLRSQSTCRASLQAGGDYRKNFNGNFTCLVMIEHIEAVKNIDDILAVPGISGCFIGPTDLESSMKHTENDIRSAMTQAVEKVKDAAKKSRKIIGIASPDVDHANQLRKQGYDFIIVSTDRKMMRDATSAISSSWQREVQNVV